MDVLVPTSPLMVFKQITYDAPSHQLHTKTFRRNLQCRFDHRTFHVQAFRCEPQHLSVRRPSIEFMVSPRVAHLNQSIALGTEHDRPRFSTRDERLVGQ